jgi:hypothetical protein
MIIIGREIDSFNVKCMRLQKVINKDTFTYFLVLVF